DIDLEEEIFSADYKQINDEAEVEPQEKNLNNSTDNLSAENDFIVEVDQSNNNSHVPIVISDDDFIVIEND
ncbi:MAG: hypothetical protein MHPSP_004047, partial [Paramarteilia canceri]